jgi:hypothetical protein
MIDPPLNETVAKPTVPAYQSISLRFAPASAPIPGTSLVRARFGRFAGKVN